MRKAMLSVGAMLMCSIAFAYNENPLSISDGQIRYNTETAKLEYSNDAGGSWAEIGSGGTGGGSTVKVNDVTKTTVDLNTSNDVTVAISGENVTFDVSGNLGLDSAVFSGNAPAVPVVGQLWYDTAARTLNVKDGTATSLQIGEEQRMDARNNTGVQINDGSVVYVSGGLGSQTLISLGDADLDIARKTIGFATENIADNGSGKVTLFGSVNGQNTSSFTVGDELFLSSTAGGYTNAVPYLTHGVSLGHVTYANNNNGVIQANVRDVDGVDRTLVKDPTGFTSPSLTTPFDASTMVALSYDPSTRKITVTGTALAYFRNFNVPDIDGSYTSAAHTDAAGVYYLYFNGIGFVWTTSIWTFDMLQVAVAIYNGSGTGWAIKETHGMMPHLVHEELHRTVGTYYGAGGDMTGYTLSSTTASNRRPIVSETTMYDEDIKHVLPALATNSYTQFYLTGTGATATYTTAQTDIVPLSGNQPYYNQLNGTTWQQTLMAVNAYQKLFLVAVPTTQDGGSEAYRYLWVQGQTQSTTLSTIQAITPANVNWGTLTAATPEFLVIGEVIIRYTASNWVLISAAKITGNKFSQTASPAGNYLSSVATDATITGNGTTGSPLAVAIPWQDGGAGKAYYSAGNVGIGSTAPTSALDVVGTVTATSFSGNGAGLTGIATYSAFTKSGNDAYFAESGNLGIGSTAPTVKLDVNGRIAGTGYAKGQTKQRTITLPYPASAYALNTRTFLNGNTGVAKTVSAVYVTLDSDPTTEINANLKYADACIGLANATVVNDLDTTNGVRYDDSITSASIPAGKCEYIEWDAAPDSATAQMVLTITETNS